jgi:hypothetical protein
MNKMTKYNLRTSPPIPAFIPAEKHAIWRQCWREFYRYWRWQLSDDARFWMACRHTVGREETEKQLGPDDTFSLSAKTENA